MSFYRRLVAHCDGKQNGAGCFVSQILNPDTLQPYIDLAKLGWKVDPDGERIYCPRFKHDEERHP